jgi:NAD(P)-dependent dehydrogenase (short-subunit alcohol dehydrogenase family)
MGSDFHGKVVAVTGAGSGLGRAAAVAFAAAGASVVCNDLDESSAHATCSLIERAGGTAVACPGDVRAHSDVQEIVETALERYGGLDVMHANAAISIYEELETLGLDRFDAIIDANLKGALLCAQAAIAPLRERGGGSIVFVSSVQAFQGLPGCVPYVAAKAGLVAAARTLAVEVGRWGIRVNAVAPGTIDTPMLRRDLGPMNADERDDFLERVDHANALGRVGEAEEVAAAVLFLASEQSSYITGTCLVVDGGFLALKAL